MIKIYLVILFSIFLHSNLLRVQCAPSWRVFSRESSPNTQLDNRFVRHLKTYE
jgi:hypothetical protein